MRSSAPPLLYVLLISALVPVFSLRAQLPHRIRTDPTAPSATGMPHVDTLWTVGEEDSQRPELVFGWILQIAFDSLGRILVLDGQEAAVRAFTLSGEHVTSVGRKGEGPGEFRLPVLLAVAPDGAVFVYDAGLGRITEYAADLTFIRTFRPTPSVAPRRMLVTEDRVYVSGIMSVDPWRQLAVHVFAREDGTHITSFARLPPTESPTIGRRIGSGRVFPARDGGVWYTQPAPYLVQRYSREGELLVEIERPNDFLPSAEDAYQSHVAEGRLTITSRPHPIAIAIEEFEGGGLLHQVNLMDGRMVVDLFDSTYRLVSSVVGPLPALVTPLGKGLYAIAGGGDDTFPWIGVVRITWPRTGAGIR